MYFCCCDSPITTMETRYRKSRKRARDEEDGGGGGSGREWGPSVGVMLLVVVFRVACAVLMQTSFVPDEYWQANEVRSV